MRVNTMRHEGVSATCDKCINFTCKGYVLEDSNRLICGNHEFQIVDSVPYGYVIWNIGQNMVDGWLPLVQTGGRDGCQVIGIKKAIKVDGAQVILSAVGYGPHTIATMQKYIEENERKKNRTHCVKRMKAALPFMCKIKGL